MAHPFIDVIIGQFLPDILMLFSPLIATDTLRYTRMHASMKKRKEDMEGRYL